MYNRANEPMQFLQKKGFMPKVPLEGGGEGAKRRLANMMIY